MKSVGGGRVWSDKTDTNLAGNRYYSRTGYVSGQKAAVKVAGDDVDVVGVVAGKGSQSPKDVNGTVAPDYVRSDGRSR